MWCLVDRKAHLNPRSPAESAVGPMWALSPKGLQRPSELGAERCRWEAVPLGGHVTTAHTSQRVSLATFWGDQHRLPCPLEQEGTRLRRPGLPVPTGVPPHSCSFGGTAPELQGCKPSGPCENDRAHNLHLYAALSYPLFLERLSPSGALFSTGLSSLVKHLLAPVFYSFCVTTQHSF